MYTSVSYLGTVHLTFRSFSPTQLPFYVEQKSDYSVLVEFLMFRWKIQGHIINVYSSLRLIYFFYKEWRNKCVFYLKKITSTLQSYNMVIPLDRTTFLLHSINVVDIKERPFFRPVGRLQNIERSSRSSQFTYGKFCAFCCVVVCLFVFAFFVVFYNGTKWLHLAFFRLPKFYHSNSVSLTILGNAVNLICILKNLKYVLWSIKSSFPFLETLDINRRYTDRHLHNPGFLYWQHICCELSPCFLRQAVGTTMGTYCASILSY